MIGAQVFINEEEIKQKILSLTPEEARKCGVDRSNLKKIKDRIKRGKLSNLETKAVKRFVSCFVKSKDSNNKTYSNYLEKIL